MAIQDALINCKDWYNHSYKTEGYNAQRKYPNEEFCRFMGRNFFQIEPDIRKDIRILEVGCGSGSNIWMISKEGFDTYGCDLSEESIILCDDMMGSYQARANLSVQNMMKTNYSNNFFHCVSDVFSSYCLCESDYDLFVCEIKRILKNDGIFFSYTPSKQSESYINHKTSTLIDKSTLNGIYRTDSPFYGNFYPFRFMDIDDVHRIFESNGFRIGYCEKVSKTYNDMKETFEWISFEAHLDKKKTVPND